jgi:hypothetical protein
VYRDIVRYFLDSSTPSFLLHSHFFLANVPGYRITVQSGLFNATIDARDALPIHGVGLVMGMVTAPGPILVLDTATGTGLSL